MTFSRRLPIVMKGNASALKQANVIDSCTSMAQKKPTNAKTPLRVCALALALALGAASGWAQQQVFVGGARTWGGPYTITGTALYAPITAILEIPDTGSTWHCVATCSAEIFLSVAALDIDGRLALTADGAEVAGTDRKFELEDNEGINDLSPIVVSTTGVMLSLDAGEHKIACPLAKVTAGDAEFKVADESITYVCSDYSG